MNDVDGRASPETAEPEPGLAPSRLHPATLWLPLFDAVKALAIAFLIFALSAGALWMLALVAVFALLPFMAFQVSRYLSFRYELRGRDLIISSGLLWRRERRIPLRRVQDTVIEQGLIHQWLGLARLRITTAGSEGQEAALDVIALDEAERVRAAILSCQNALSGAGERATGQPALRREELLRLPVSTLVLGGLTSKVAATLGALVGAVVYFEFVVRLGNRYVKGFGNATNPFTYLNLPFTKFISIPPQAQKALETAEYLEKITDRYWYLSLIRYFLEDSLGKAVIVILAGLAISILAFLIRHFRYRLTRSGGVLTSNRGLLTSSTSSLVQDHVVALKIEENLLRRWFGLASVAVDSGGDQAAADEVARKRESFIPVVARSQLPRLVSEILPDVGTDTRWRPVSRKAVLRESRKAWLALVALGIATHSYLGWYSLGWLPVVPLVYYIHVRIYRHTGYTADGKYLLSRKGGFNRQTLYLPVRNLQSVIVSENCFDRRLGLATLVVDTAGQTNTGGGASIRNLPAADARQLQAALAQSVAHSKFIL